MSQTLLYRSAFFYYKEENKLGKVISFKEGISKLSYSVLLKNHLTNDLCEQELESRLNTKKKKLTSRKVSKIKFERND